MVGSSTQPTTSGSVSFNAADYLVDRHVREGDGDRVAVVSANRTLSYAELSEQVHRVAAGFGSLGLRPEERVMFCMADDVELLSGILGAMYAGIVPVPVSTMVTGTELGKVLADSRARVLCASTEFADAAGAALGVAREVTDVVLDGEVDLDTDGSRRLHQFADVADRGEGGPATPYDTWEDSPALWLYTSGTTGLPKGAMHRHASIRLVAELYGSGVLGVRPSDRHLSVAKLFFAYGIGNSAFFPLAAGASAVLERARPTPQVIAERARQTQPTLFFGVPTFYSALLNSDVADDSFSSVRQGVSAGEPLPASIFHRFRERFGVEILDGIGSTEALHIFLSNRPGEVTPGSSGTPVPGYDVQIRDPLDGRVITEASEPGELFLRGPSVAFGYYCRYDVSRTLFQGEWLRTGDTYVRNENGTMSCLGRTNDMIKVGGIWVSPAEVEERLLQHPDVAEVVVVAVADEVGLDKPVACVVPAEGRGVDEASLDGWAREGLAAFKRPRHVLEVAELPKTATGKIKRNVLRDMVRENLGARQGPPDVPASATVSG